MERRSFLKQAAISAATLGAAAPATLLAADDAKSADLPTVTWRLTSSFPKSLDTIYGASDILAATLDKITGG
ncbi:MAG: twin-arginine translocation signal domain-containing protein, partial [Thiothrix litoralis]